MRVNVTFRNIAPDEHADVRALLESLVDKRVAKVLGRVAGKAPRLDAVVDRHASGERVRVRLRVPVPGTVLVSHEVGPLLQEVVHEAVYELARQARRYAARVEHRDARQRRRRRPALRRLRGAVESLPAEASGQETTTTEAPERFFETVRHELEVLRSFARHELTYLRATGELAPDVPTLDDVLDEVLARALERFPSRPAAMSNRAWLLELAVSYLDEEREQARRQGTRLPLDERVAPPAGVLVDDEMMDFWQPDEVLRVEDLVPAHWQPDGDAAWTERGEGAKGSDGAAAVASREAAVVAYQLLAQVPHTWRRALTLRDVYELSDDEAAAALATDAAELARWSDAAAHFVDARAHGLGVDLGGEDGARAVFGAARQRQPDDVTWHEEVRALLVDAAS